MTASRKQQFTSLANKDKNTSSEEPSDEDSDPGGSSYSPPDICSTESDMVSLFKTVYNRLMKSGHRTMSFLVMTWNLNIIFCQCHCNSNVDPLINK
jgi:hypothetical protein